MRSLLKRAGDSAAPHGYRSSVFYQAAEVLAHPAQGLQYSKQSWCMPKGGCRTQHPLVIAKLPSALCDRLRSRPAALTQALRDLKQALVHAHGLPCHAALLCQAALFACTCPTLHSKRRAWHIVKGPQAVAGEWCGKGKHYAMWVCFDAAHANTRPPKLYAQAGAGDLGSST